MNLQILHPSLFLPRRVFWPIGLLAVSVPILAKIPTSRKEVTPTGASQAKSVSLATYLVISASDPFVALS